MVKIRLMRIGTKNRPFYRVVAVDGRSKRTGGYLELLGTYNPLTEPKEIKLKQELIDKWIKQGAQMSDGFLRIIGKAKQRLPRKAKKEAKKVEEQQPAAVAVDTQPAPSKDESSDNETKESAEAPRPEDDQPLADAEEIPAEVAEAPEAAAPVEEAIPATEPEAEQPESVAEPNEEKTEPAPEPEAEAVTKEK